MPKKQMSYTRAGEIHEEPDDCGIGGDDVCEAKDSERRFRLVEIAFDQLLRRAFKESKWKWNDIGLGAVSAADAALAAMEKADGVRPTCRTTLEFVRCSVQSYLDSRLDYYARNPADKDECVLGHRSGIQHACNDILELIEAEMEKTGKQVNAIPPVTSEELSEETQFITLRNRWRRNYPHVANAMDGVQRSLAALEGVLIEDRAGGEPEAEIKGGRAACPQCGQLIPLGKCRGCGLPLCPLCHHQTRPDCETNEQEKPEAETNDAKTK